VNDESLDIRERFLSSGRAVFKMVQLSNILRISRDHVKMYASRLKPWQEDKRYVQALVFYALSGWPIIMNGGTYLWFFHGPNKFYDDLDFART